MTDAEAIEAIMAAGDKQEAIGWAGNTMTSLTLSSVSVGKQVVYAYALDGGVTGYSVSDI